ncbi:MAG: SET domain-containing protein-lysine N-methyltransferase [bacterium]
MHNIPEEDYIDPRVKRKKFSTGGYGLFAIAPIKKGELVIRWGGGVIITDKEFQKGFKEGKYQSESAIHFDENLKWVSLASDSDYIDAAINHSCDPNLWFENGWPLVARRDIAKSEELTFDYATGETYPLNSECHCGAKDCRKNITGEEWKSQKFRNKYKGHFNPYIQGLINKQKTK